ncbi:agmatine deiminase family protein [Acidihalobacter ferrooxydans]|uniref:Agmatine deiminase n=1 Tax=Acidihalobacter ferrooxydans TaxID=1765967 RepID=A0A1P8UFD3_9GAMM|nr:agmatine deiminase family protein [Acidihalobacter ferrooxydans]APZ42501.1 agmatine deiminase [Acidihalobacter ferrooxydans]
MTLGDTRRALPAEWAVQSGVMLTWSHARTFWAPQLAAVERVYLEIAAAVCAREDLLVVCHDAAHRDHVNALLDAHCCPQQRRHLVIAPSDDTWARDHGPIAIVEDGLPRLLDFRFNAWGEKYPYAQDNAINRAVSAAGGFGDTQLEPVDLVLEGGSIDTDGTGTLLTTRHCLLTPTRNRGMDEAAIAAELRRLFGIRRILWLDHGALAGDDTDGHIDTLARFCDEHTIAYVRCDDQADEHYAELQAMEAELQALRDAGGAPYRLLPLPLPRAHYKHDGQRLPATYANFLIINGAVLMPTYDDPVHDPMALDILSGAFPDREVIGINCVPIIQQYGSLHCLTMQLPAGVLPVKPH